MAKKYQITRRMDHSGNMVKAYSWGDVMHSAVYLDPAKKYELVFPYNRAFLQAFDLCRKAERVLIIGGGMYTLPSYLIRFFPQLRVDVLEPDETTVDAALKHFGLGELYEDIPDAGKRLHIIPAWGREYLSSCRKKYDVILNDAFSGAEPAYDLMSREAAELIHNVLEKDGIYAANMLGSDDICECDLMLDEMKTLRSVFAFAACDEAKDEGAGSFCNYIVFASDHDYFQDPYADELLAGTEIIEDRDLPHLKEFYEILSVVSEI